MANLRLRTYEFNGEFYYQVPDYASSETIGKVLNRTHTTESLSKRAIWRRVKNKQSKLDDIYERQDNYVRVPAFRTYPEENIEEITGRLSRAHTASSLNRGVNAVEPPRIPVRPGRFAKSSYTNEEIKAITERLHCLPTFTTWVRSVDISKDPSYYYGNDSDFNDTETMTSVRSWDDAKGKALERQTNSQRPLEKQVEKPMASVRFQPRESAQPSSRSSSSASVKTEAMTTKPGPDHITEDTQDDVNLVESSSSAGNTPPRQDIETGDYEADFEEEVEEEDEGETKVGSEHADDIEPELEGLGSTDSVDKTGTDDHKRPVTPTQQEEHIERVSGSSSRTISAISVESEAESRSGSMSKSERSSRSRGEESTASSAVSRATNVSKQANESELKESRESLCRGSDQSLRMGGEKEEYNSSAEQTESRTSSRMSRRTDTSDRRKEGIPHQQRGADKDAESSTSMADTGTPSTVSLRGKSNVGGETRNGTPRIRSGMNNSKESLQRQSLGSQNSLEKTQRCAPNSTKSSASSRVSSANSGLISPGKPEGSEVHDNNNSGKQAIHKMSRASSAVSRSSKYSLASGQLYANPTAQKQATFGSKSRVDAKHKDPDTVSESSRSTRSIGSTSSVRSSCFETFAKTDNREREARSSSAKSKTISEI